MDGHGFFSSVFTVETYANSHPNERKWLAEQLRVLYCIKSFRSLLTPHSNTLRGDYQNVEASKSQLRKGNL